MKIRHPEIVEISACALEFTRSPRDVRPVISPWHSHDAWIVCRVGGGQHGLFQRDRFTRCGDPVMLDVVSAIAVLSEDRGRKRARQITGSGPRLVTPAMAPIFVISAPLLVRSGRSRLGRSKGRQTGYW